MTQTIRDQVLDIGEVIEATGVPATTLHVWEQRRLLAPVGRAGLRRQYDPDVIERIAVIVVCQRSGFTLTEIGALLAPGAFDAGKSQLEGKLLELRQRRADLDKAIDGIEHALACQHPSPLECPSFRNRLAGILPVTGDAKPR